MALIVENKVLWRRIVLALLFLSLMGPWLYDRLNIPAEYPCGPSASIRLHGDFCGSPLLGFLVIPVNAAGFLVMALEWIAGTFSGRTEQFISGLAWLPLLAGFSTLLMIRKPDSRRAPIVSLLLWGISCIPPLLIINLYQTKAIYLWGPGFTLDSRSL